LSLIQELKRRNVIRVGIAYIVSAWLVIQVVETLFPVFEFGNEAIRIIVIVLAIGLLPVLFFAWAFELTPGGVKREKDIDRSRSITHQTGKKLDRVVIVLLAIGLALFAFDKFILDPSRDTEMVESAARDAVETYQNQTPDKSIAVLPFVNMSSDPEQEFFSDGIAEEILNTLTRVDAFRVAGRTSSFAFKGRNEDLRSIGDALNVAYVLEGSVRKSGDKLRITAQLIKVDDGYHLWSENYDRQLTDVFAIQDEISEMIFRQLVAHVLGDEELLAESTRTDPETYELYLQARQLIYERETQSLERAQRGIVWFLLADRNYGNIPADKAYAQSRLRIDKALELDSELAEAWAALGLWFSYNGANDPGKAIEALNKSLSINPYQVDALNWLQGVLRQSGDLEGSFAIIELILDRDPLYVPAIRNAINYYASKEDYAKALALLERVKPMFMDEKEFVGFEGELYFLQGQYAKAQQLIEQTDPRRSMRGTRRFWLPFIWNETHQFKRSAEQNYEGHARAIAFWHLDHVDEATELALQLTGPETTELAPLIQPYFQILNASNQSQTLIDFVEARWTLDEIEEQFPLDRDLMGYAPLNEIALAYIRADETEKAQDALARVKFGQESTAQPQRRVQFSLNRAVYFALMGDDDAALQHLAKAIDGGYIGPIRLARLWPAFASLEGDPRYEQIQSRMIKHLNEERKALGLDPIQE
jgi:TolB-like protein/Tfp pilus assembly protein PilF